LLSPSAVCAEPSVGAAAAEDAEGLTVTEGVSSMSSPVDRRRYL